MNNRATNPHAYITHGSAIVRSGHAYLDSLDSSYQKTKLELSLFWSSELGKEVSKMMNFVEAFQDFEATLDRLNDRQSPENFQNCQQSFRALEAIADIKRPNL